MRKLLKRIEVQLFLLRTRRDLDKYKRALSEENLIKAREEVVAWRRESGVDYRGRPLQAPKCKCGQETQLWPSKDTGIWCVFFSERLDYEDRKPTRHDVFDINAKKIATGMCTALPTSANFDS